MRLAAVDAGAGDARTERAIAVALGSAPDRLLLFGEAAAVAARAAARDVARRDERFLDAAAAWLLDAPASGDVDGVPSRARLPVPLVEIAVAVGAEHPPLSSTPRALEMLGARLCMAVPDGASLDPDEIDNAALWICGGGGPFRVESVKGRTILSPGDVGAEGYVALVDTAGGELRITRVDLDGNAFEAGAAAPAGPRLQVQG